MEKEINVEEVIVHHSYFHIKHLITGTTIINGTKSKNIIFKRKRHCTAEACWKSGSERLHSCLSSQIRRKHCGEKSHGSRYINGPLTLVAGIPLVLQIFLNFSGWGRKEDNKPSKVLRSVDLKVSRELKHGFLTVYSTGGKGTCKVI